MLHGSKTVIGVLWVSSVALVAAVAYLLGWSAESKFEDLMTSHTPAPEQQLQDEGRYDEAIHVVLDRRKEGLREADAYSEVALIYLNRAKKDRANRGKWAQQAAQYIDKATASSPKDPLLLETAMDDLNVVGDYLENGCPDYEKAIQFGDAALALLQGSEVRIEGYARTYPTRPIKESLQPRLKRIRRKVDCCCKKDAKDAAELAGP